jgi:hypothetical protein
MYGVGGETTGLDIGRSGSRGGKYIFSGVAEKTYGKKVTDCSRSSLNLQERPYDRSLK